MYIHVHVGETGRRYGVSEKENMKDVKHLERVNYTRAKKRESQKEHHQSVLTDHAATTPLIGKESRYQPKTLIGLKEVLERPSASGRQGLMPSTAMRGAIISPMCIPSCCSLQPHLSEALRDV